MDRLPNTVGAFVAGESLEDMLFNDEEE
jgi:hypothetical protein